MSKTICHAFQALFPLLAVSLVATSLNAQTTMPAVDSWLLNTTGAKGSSIDDEINAIVSQFDADVQQVRDNATDVYINATGIPSYSIGPWPATNPAVATDRNYLIRIPKTPQEQLDPKTPTPLADIGLWINGVAIYNAWDAQCFDFPTCNWQQDATVFELAGQDAANGHPAEVAGGGMIDGFKEGEYHHHFDPTGLRTQLGDDGTSHSPILGFAYDGFPVYGPYGYENPDGTGGLMRMESSYQLRTGDRPNGPGGPFDGSYLQDWEYVDGLGHLDEHNGRFAVTPEYPNGTYAYYVTLDASLDTMYPHIIGPEYFGVVIQENISQTVSVPIEFATAAIIKAQDIVAVLGPGQVGEPSDQQNFLRYLDNALRDIDAGRTVKGLHKRAAHNLEKALARTDGCILNPPLGTPDSQGDGGDWITDCAVQEEVFALLSEALDVLQNLNAGT
jgi:hypothetical protein